jgi:hypothetical protein
MSLWRKGGVTHALPFQRQRGLVVHTQGPCFSDKGAALDTNRINASYDQGVLTL